MKKVMLVFGTRPEAIKMLWKLTEAKHKLAKYREWCLSSVRI